MQPKISFIIVVFNDAELLPTAMQSVLEQTYENLELIVVDGGSKDGTVEILEKNVVDNLVWISEPDKGIYDAMNKGIAMVSGEWVFFLGADDELYHKTIVETIFKDPVTEQVEFIYGNIISVGNHHWYDGKFNYEKLLKKNISHQAIFYHKNIFKKIGNFNLKYRTHSDWDLNLRYFDSEQPRIKYVDKAIARFGTGGASSEYDLPFLKESLMPKKMEFLKINKRALHGLKDYDEFWRFIRNAGFRTQGDFIDSGYRSAIPSVVFSMMKWQNRLPDSLLRNGVISKTIMFLNYLFNYNKI